MNDHLNLLPLVVLRRNLLWLRLRQWCLVWLAVLSTCVVVTCVQTWQLASQHYRLSQLQVSSQPLRMIQKDLDRMRLRLNRLRSRESMLAMLERMEQPVQLLGIIGRSAGGDRPEVQVCDLFVSPTQIAQVTRPSSAVAAGLNGGPPTSHNVDRVHLKIDGIGVDDLAVARFVAGLREAGVFETVALKSSIRAGRFAGESRQFSVECVFQ